MKELIEGILRELGEDPKREGLEKTPARVESMLQFLTSGYRQDVGEVLNGAVFAEDHYDQMVLVKDIDFYSLCEHHLLPFFGKAHIDYLPNGKIAGLSKLARAVEVLAKRPQIQEKMTEELADFLMEELKRVVGETVLGRFDHAFINDDPAFPPGVLPTTENLVRTAWDLLVAKLGAEALTGLRLWEDPTLYVDYRGEV